MLERNLIPFSLSTEESALVRGGFFRRSRENKGKTNMKQLKFMLVKTVNSVYVMNYGLYN